MKKIIFTSITGNYDTIIDTIPMPGWEYHLITNNKTLKSNVWKISYINTIIDQVRTARYVKTHPFKFFDSDISIWVDANVKLSCNFDALVNVYKKGEFTIMRHPDRDCVYEEIIACKRGNKDNPEIMDLQIAYYKSKGYPEKNGMVSSGLIIRENNKSVIDFCESWWQEIVRWSYRDQLSFNYLSWKECYRFEYMPFLFNISDIGLIINLGHRKS